MKIYHVTGTDPDDVMVDEVEAHNCHIFSGALVFTNHRGNMIKAYATDSWSEVEQVRDYNDPVS